MAAIRIRLARLQDREALCRLYFEFHEFHVRGVPDRLVSSGRPPDIYEGSDLYLTLGMIITDDDAVLFVATVDGQPVGLAEAYVRQDDPDPLKVAHRYGLLQSLMVREVFRRQGIGTRLLEAVQQWARVKGATEMRLDTWEFEAGPLEFYEKRSYRTLRRTLVRGL
jgi:GNAT superfamily N-acetyltransferase